VVVAKSLPLATGYPGNRCDANCLATYRAGLLRLVIASCLYSLPFAVQPMQSAFESLPRKNLEAAWTLGASKLDAFLSVAVPLSMRGFISAAVLSFAHTLGEFGVVLMVGGNIPGETRVSSACSSSTGAGNHDD